MGNRASSFKWVWGTDPDKSGQNPSQNVLGSTGAGVVFNTHRWGENFTFIFETNDSGWAYQIRGARNSSGPWAILSSNSGTSTAVADIVQIPGPFKFLSPRVDALASTGNYALIEMQAVEA